MNPGIREDESRGLSAPAKDGNRGELRLEKRKVIVLIGGQPCSFYSDDPDEYISALAQRANAAMRQTAKFSGTSPYTNAVLSVLFLADQLLRREQAEAEGRDRPEQAEKPTRAEQKGGRKPHSKAAAEDAGQVSVWDLLDGRIN